MSLLSQVEAPLLRRHTSSSTGEPEHGAFHPRTISAIVIRIQALTVELLPIQVNPSELTNWRGSKHIARRARAFAFVHEKSYHGAHEQLKLEHTCLYKI
jgi:hypothetical protein